MSKKFVRYLCVIVGKFMTKLSLYELIVKKYRLIQSTTSVLPRAI